ncbi:PilZ domain-containing protein [Roseospira visakhapatnamensis]|uniref:PilZ domain-containing protein n=1 Tax=Roseospira visakhapatnamensis TaxID=390880 RepID=A0A7W6R9Y5_9PROT|nr:PilZ domain-containing protein [Roseospira visakhapatnamensis]MBB4264656.1 hypothetical protein [Roseospira visakhapatnamensis]
MTSTHPEPTGTASDQDRRDHPRWELPETAKLILDSEYDVSCAIGDVSGSGLLVNTALAPRIGDEAIIYVRSLGRFRAQVARVSDGQVAFRFLIEDERQVLLLQRLERRLQQPPDATGAPADPAR